jgi:endonuclease I
VSDLFNLRASTTSVNSERGNLHFGGAFGQPFGDVVDKGATVWYPGNADAGMIARQEFYMAVRYDGSDSGTSDLELVSNGTTGTAARLGDLSRMIEWHYAAPPDSFERRRNQVIYDNFQHNRNPFTDRPEYVWSIFMNQTNDSGLTLLGGTSGAELRREPSIWEECWSAPPSPRPKR